MEMTITTAVLATLISALTSALVTLGVNKRSEKRNINDQLDAILKIAIQYPYVENQSFTSSWMTNKNSNEEKYLRYDIYCTLLFNYLSRVADFYKYDKNKIENYIAIKDWVRLHKDYWISPLDTFENIDGYDKKFRDLINYYIK
jgi:hypothetical protein